MSKSAMLGGRIAIVTGGGRGIGRAHCLELALHGATVVVSDIDDGSDAVAEVATEIEAFGGIAVTDHTSVTDFEGVAQLVERTIRDHGRLDIVVNNAGILRDGMIWSLTEDDWDSVIAVHLKGTFAMLKHAAVYWHAEAKAGRTVKGRVINTTSGTGLFGNAGQANYGAAKAAIANITIIAAAELGRYGVTVNAISPIARTRMTETLPMMVSSSQSGEWDPYDPANSSPVVAWLASEASGWLTGAVLRVEGDTVVRVAPWEIDPTVSYATAERSRLDTARLDSAIHAAYRLAATRPAPDHPVSDLT